MILNMIKANFPNNFSFEVNHYICMCLDVSIFHIYFLLIGLFIYCGSRICISAEFGESTVNRDLLTVVTLDDGTLKENDSTKYDFQLKGQLKNHPEYNFKSGSKCVGVKYNGVEVWVYDYNKNQKYPTSVKLDPVSQTLWVQFDTFDFYTFQFSESKWKFNDQVSSGSGKIYDETLSLSNFFENLKETIISTVVELESSTSSKTLEPKEDTQTHETRDEEAFSDQLLEKDINLEDSNNDKPEHFYVVERHEKSSHILKVLTLVDYTLNCNDNTEYDLIITAGPTVFKFKCSTKNGTKYGENGQSENNQGKERGIKPLKINIKMSNFVMVNFSPDKGYQCTYKEWRRKPGNKSTLSKELDFDKLRVVTLSDEGLPVENDTSKYDRTVTENIAKYKFKEGCKCTDLKYNNEAVWSYDPEDHEDEYPTLVAVNKSNNLLFIESFLYQYYYHYNNKWNLLLFLTQIKIGSPLAQSYFTLDHSRYASGININSNNYENIHVPLNYNHNADQNSTLKYDIQLSVGDNLFKFNSTSKFGIREELHTSNEYKQDEIEDDFPIKMRVKLNDYFMYISFNPYNNYLYTYDQWEHQLDEKSTLSKELDFDKLGVVTLSDEGLPVENDTSKYDRTVTENIAKYKFKEGCKCTDLKYNNEAVWSYDPEDHEDEYPTLVALNVSSNFLFVESEGSYRYTYSFYNNKWNQVSGYKAKEEALEKLDPNKLELVTLNRDGSTSKNDSTLCDKKDLDGFSVFVFNPDVKCTIVRYDGHTLWTHSEEEFGTDFPTSVTLHVERSYVMVDSGNKYCYMYTYYGEWKQELGYKSTLSKPLDFDKLTVVTLEDDQTTKENDTTKYTRKDSTYQSNYKFKPDAKCTEVKYDGVTVWNHNVNEHSNDYPDQLALNKYANILLVDFNKYQDFYLYYNFRWHFLRLYNPNMILQSIFNAEFEPTQIVPPFDQLQPTFHSFEENDGLRQDSTHQESKLLQVESSPHLN